MVLSLTARGLLKSGVYVYMCIYTYGSTVENACWCIVWNHDGMGYERKGLRCVMVSVAKLSCL